MAQCFMADVLLDRPWLPDPRELAAILKDRFEGLGEVEAARAEGADRSVLPALRIDGALLPLTLVPVRHPLAAEVLREAAPLRPARSWDPSRVLATHRAHVRLACSGPGGGHDWMRAYATVVTLVAGCIARIGPSPGVVFPTSCAVLTPEEAFRAGRMAIGGVSPIEAWVSLIPYRSVRPSTSVTAAGDQSQAHGALTLGLAPFLGREIEIAPEPRTAAEAVQRAQGLTWQVLDADLHLSEGASLADPGAGTRTRVRAVPSWLRPGVPAFVLVGAASEVDPDSLTLRRAADPLRLPRIGPALADLGASARGRSVLAAVAERLNSRPFAGTMAAARARIAGITGFRRNGDHHA